MKITLSTNKHFQFSHRYMNLFQNYISNFLIENKCKSNGKNTMSTKRQQFSLTLTHFNSEFHDFHRYSTLNDSKYSLDRHYYNTLSFNCNVYKTSLQKKTNFNK